MILNDNVSTLFGTPNSYTPEYAGLVFTEVGKERHLKGESGWSFHVVDQAFSVAPLFKLSSSQTPQLSV